MTPTADGGRPCGRSATCIRVTPETSRSPSRCTRSSPDDWLIVAGDVAERTDEIRWSLDLLRKRFAKVIWVPGNHELWTTNRDPMQIFGKARYDYLVDMCDEMGIVTPEHPYPVWTEEGGPATIVPMFLLYDYTFLPDGAATKAEGLALARERNVVGTDEFLLSSEPYATRDAWCRDRVARTRKRLEDLDWMTPTVLVNHFPLVREPCEAMFYPEFSLWCGTTATADWHTRYNAVCSVYGHLHIPRTTWYDGVRFEEVSVGYPREWRRRKPYRWLRQVLPDPKLRAGLPQRVRWSLRDHPGDAGQRGAHAGADRQRQSDDHRRHAAHRCAAGSPVVCSRRNVRRPTGIGAAAGGGAADRPVGGQAAQRVRHRPVLRAAGARPSWACHAVPILKGEKGEPCWPDGVVGSLTHCEGYRGAAVGPARQGAIGGNRRRTARRAAQRCARRHQPAGGARRTRRGCPSGLHWDRILFCAKEATYKAWFPVTRRWLGFEDAHIAFTVDDGGSSGRFESRILIDGQAVSGPPLETSVRALVGA